MNGTTEAAAPRARLHLARRGSLWVGRAIAILLTLAIVIAAGAVLAVRYWLLPNVDDFRDRVAQAISEAANQRVTIGALRGEWAGLRPRLAIHDLRIYDAGGGERMALESVDGTLSWMSLMGTVRFESIAVRRLGLEVRRDRAGKVFVAGMPIKQDGGRGGFGDWLLEQHRLDMRDSTLTWIDEALGGVPLALQDVQLQIEKRHRSWQFALRALAPQASAQPIDIRGELARSSFGERAWSGKVYMRMDYVDLVSLRQWIALPAQFERGAGAIEVWSTLDASQVKDVMADLSLANVRLRLAARLPFLDLSKMSGRLAWSKDAPGIDMSARRLTFTTPDGLRMPPGDFRFKRTGAEDDANAQSELRFDSLDLAALMRLADRLPLDERLRQRLGEMSPRGTVHDFQFAWTGPLETRSRYQLRAAFDGIAMSASGYLPGFSSVSGTLEASERGGAASLRAGSGELAMPRVFATPLPLQSLDARVTWNNSANGQLVKIERAVFANPHLAGKVSGTYQLVPGQPGVIDLAGSLERGDGREAWRYIPLVVYDDVRSWLRDAIVQGRVIATQFKVRGDMRKFPFVDPASGTFDVKLQFDQGILAFAPHWPHIEGITGQLVFNGASMTVTSPQAQVYGSVLRNVNVHLPNLLHDDPVLEIRGESEGPSQDVLRYIEQSDIDDYLHGFTRGMRGSGRGVLGLRVDLPVKHMRDAKVAGSYRFSGNSLEVGHGAPRMEQLSGQLQFTERDVRAQDIAVNIQGMPARFNLAREGERVVLRGRGTADAAAIRRLADHPVARQLSGSVEWTAAVAVGNDGYDIGIESDLRGLALALPAPLAKDAASTLPFRLHKRSLDATREAVTLTLGTSVSAQLEQTRDERAPRLLRGEVRVGEAAPPPSRDGVWVVARTARLDIDRWLALLDSPGGGSGSAANPLAGIELRVGELTAYGRTWHDVDVNARRERQWLARINATEVSGVVQYDPANAGSVAGRLARLYLPETEPRADTGAPAAPAPAPRSLPAVDLTADDFRLGTRSFGQLRLVADNESRDWRIRQLGLTSPQGTINATGVWQIGTRVPVTRVDFTAEVSDIGAYFARLQLPPGVKGGSGRVAGNISWNGAPISLDLPTLAGALQLEAKKGRFVKVEPGLGKLIGVLSLQALPRRVTLDFRDVFSSGFAFDQIRANVAVSRGIAHTEDFSMLGSAARVEMKGDVNLAGETQRLDVKILPSLSEGVALGAALLNPAVGIAALLAQIVMKDPLSHLAAFDYEISGTWTDPIVMKKRRDSAAASSRR